MKGENIMTDKKLNFKTMIVNGRQILVPATGTAAVPIYQSQSFVFKNSDRVSNLSEYLFKYK